MEKNKNYWNKGLPYLDGIEFYHVLPFSPELGSAILSGRVDYVRITDPVTARKAKATPGMSTTAFNQSVIQGTWVNNKKKPFDDPRVRRALHLAFDRPVADRRRQGRDADAGRRLHLSVLRIRHADGGAGQAGRLSGRSRPPRSRKRRR